MNGLIYDYKIQIVKNECQPLNCRGWFVNEKSFERFKKDQNQIGRTVLEEKIVSRDVPRPKMYS